MDETALSMMLCTFLGGSEAETHQYFDVNGMRRYVRVDCETDTHVIEVGLDGKASSRDSLHQAMFYAHLTGKTPAVVMIDRDGFEGRFEYELRQTTAVAGVEYLRCAEDFIVRWRMTRPFRDVMGDDLPAAEIAGAGCDLAVVRSEPSS
ncbi:MAG: hypothetical protein AB8B82_02895 [Roseovarius sp.]